MRPGTVASGPDELAGEVGHGHATSAQRSGSGDHVVVDVQVVPRRSDQPGFHIVKRRWVVERTLGWLMLHRRLARDYETRPDHAAAMIRLASIDNLARRITDETTPTWRYA